MFFAILFINIYKKINPNNATAYTVKVIYETVQWHILLLLLLIFRLFLNHLQNQLNKK